MLQKNDWLMLKLLYLVVMLNAWLSLANSFDGCGVGQFRCDNNRCIFTNWLCDGDSDCSDDSDEDPSNCNATCPATKFACRNKRCINQRWVCDDEDDCGDNSDEANCPPPTCEPSTQFTCSNNECVSSRWRCDGHTDCSDGSDELNCKDLLPQNRSNYCTSTEFSCSNKMLCIHQNWVCDGDEDCSDGSDEQNCTTPDPACDPLKQFDCGNGSCIPLSSVCDSKPDCLGEKDELPNLCIKDECLIDNGGCSHICMDLYIGFRCECRNGYKLINNQTCEDIDECMEPESCSQICTNQIGGFNCSCTSGYLRDPLDYTRCKAAEGNASLLVGGLFGIHRVALDRHDNITEILNNIDMLKSLDFDVRDDMIFWMDEKRIHKAPIDEANNQTVMIDCDLTTPEHIAVDWIYNHIYWTDAGKRTIELANFESNMRKTIISDGLDKPRAIALNPLEGWMFWTDVGANTRIERAGMDGSHRSIIIETEIIYPTGLTLDLVGKKLYWVDEILTTIASCNYDGSERSVTLFSPDLLSTSYSITAFENHIFWMNWKNDTIFKVNKYTGKEVQAVISFEHYVYPQTLQIYHPSRQPDGKNHCESFNGHCSHLCLPTPEINSTSPLFTCACPDRLELLSDGLTCVENREKDEQPPLCIKNECLFDNGGCSHTCIDLHIGFRCECRNGYKLINNQTCEDIDECMEPGSCSQFCTNQIGGFNCSCASGYLTDPLDYTRCKAAEGNASLLIGGVYDIYQVAFDREENMTEVKNDIDILKSLDFDYQTGTTFWTDEKKIYKDLIDDANNQTVMIDGNITMPECLAVDWIYNRIYWTDAGKKTIELANFESNMRKTIIDDRLQNPRAIVVNPIEAWMFWTDLGGNARIERAGMDGSHRSIIIKTEISYPSALSLDLVQRKLYWVDAHLSTIASCNYDGSGRRVILHSPHFLSSSHGLTTFEDHIFWSNWDKMGIFKANKFTGEGVQAAIPLGSVVYPKTLQIYHPFRQPDGKNQCESFNGHCSHLCLPTPEINSTSPLFTCACPDGLELLSDGLTCFENGSFGQQTLICDRIRMNPGLQKISEIDLLCQALKIAEHREILHKAQLQEIRRQNAELLREQRGRCQPQLEDLQGYNIRNRRGITSLFKEPDFE